MGFTLNDKFWRGGSGSTDDEKGDFTRVNEVADTIDNAAAVDKSGGLVGIPITGHAFSADDPVTIADTTNYDGVYKIVSQTTNEIVITATYVAETFGGTETAKTYLASNWVVAAGSDGEPDLGVSYPVAADTMHFTGRATIVPTTYTGTKHVKGSHYNCYDNMDQGPDDCQGVEIAAGFTGLIGKNSALGASPDPLQLSLAAGKVLSFRSDSEAHIKIKTASKVVPKVVHDSASGILAISGVNDTNAVWTLIEIYGAGTLEVEDDTKFTDIYNFGTAIVTIKETCPAGNVYAYGGAVYSDSPLAAVKGYGTATFTLGQTSLTNPQEDLDIASLEWLSSGIFTWRAAGKMTACSNLGGGRINVVGPGDKQIGNSSNTFYLYSGTFDASGQEGSLSLGSGCTILEKGGNFIAPPGTEITAFTTGN